ncbi:MAG: GNAT family N-acetyltransferase [Xanthomonadales bacterium]|nr:GNAT family N-acetyltransferase [Xanthomonadales bacterium]
MSQALKVDSRVWLDTPKIEYAREFIAAMQDSRGLHYPWVSAPADPESWRRYLQRLQRDNEAGFLLRRARDNAICGVVNLNVITYEALCSAYLSYYAVQKYAERGYMKEGLQQVIDRAFGEMGLHRLEANIQPGNERSIRLVESLGFECEGYSPRYLMINGKWRDHERWAILADRESL